MIRVMVVTEHVFAGEEEYRRYVRAMREQASAGVFPMNVVQALAGKQPAKWHTPASVGVAETTTSYEVIDEGTAS
jgi:hypothetical protein